MLRQVLRLFAPTPLPHHRQQERLVHPGALERARGKMLLRCALRQVHFSLRLSLAAAAASAMSWMRLGQCCGPQRSTRGCRCLQRCGVCVGCGPVSMWLMLVMVLRPPLRPTPCLSCLQVYHPPGTQRGAAAAPNAPRIISSLEMDSEERLFAAAGVLARIVIYDYEQVGLVLRWSGVITHGPSFTCESDGQSGRNREPAAWTLRPPFPAALSPFTASC